jgi:hypothetical protein
MKNRSYFLNFVFLLVSFFLFITNSTECSANQSNLKSNSFGAGIILGDPSGLSGKLWLDRKHAVDFGLAFSFNSYFLIFSDYLIHFPGAFGKSGAFLAQLNPYIGVGGSLAVSTDSNRSKGPFSDRKDFTALGVRVPLGIEWLPGNPPIGVFVEFVPGLYIIPGTEGFLNAGIGARYYF